MQCMRVCAVSSREEGAMYACVCLSLLCPLTVVIREGQTDILIIPRTRRAKHEHIILANTDGNKRRVREAKGQQLGRACILELTGHAGEHARELKLAVRLPLRAVLRERLGDLDACARG